MLSLSKRHVLLLVLELEPLLRDHFFNVGNDTFVLLGFPEAVLGTVEVGNLWLLLVSDDIDLFKLIFD